MRERDDVILRISAVYSERVQLHQLARVVLVDSFEAAGRARSAGRGVLPVVKIKQHRRMPGGGAEQFPEPAHRMRSDGLLLEGSGPDAAQTLAGKDVEVVEPERGHHFLELARALDCTEEARLDRLAHHDPGAPLRRFAGVLVLFFRRKPDGPLELDEQCNRSHPRRAVSEHAVH